MRIIDLFCGAGGLTRGFMPFEPARYLGLEKALPSLDAQLVLANDFDGDALASYAANFGGDHCVSGSIGDFIASNAPWPEADVVIGGPPCQGFSLLNKKKAGDTRRGLWQAYMDLVEHSGARVFLMENVPQLIDSPEFGAIRKRAESLGFFVHAAKLLAADFGVPQRRTRAFILGTLGAEPIEFPPPPTHADPKRASTLGLPVWRTFSAAVHDLPHVPVGTEIRVDQRPPLDLHFGRDPRPLSLERYRTIREGECRIQLEERRPDITPRCWIGKKGGTDLFGRLWWDRPAFTIRTEFFKPEKGRYLHPTEDRPITHREAARLQSFPDSFIFHGSKISIARQIGNAVPPLLARSLAHVVMHNLKAARGRRIRRSGIRRPVRN